MDTRSVTAPPATRELRGLALYREHGDEITPLGHGRYEVPGCSGGSYTVDLAVFGGEESCSCPDRAAVCKHIIAATIHRSKARAACRRVQRPQFDSAAVEANLARMGA